jgi:quinol-cytochrome oxidoreductase complex cytochrome b subunit
MRDVNNGWLIRYVHANVASFFFIFVYAQCHNFYFNLFFKNFKFYISLYLKTIIKTIKTKIKTIKTKIIFFFKEIKRNLILFILNFHDKNYFKLFYFLIK